MLDFKSDNEVFDYVRKYEISEISPLSKTFASYSFNFIDIEEVLSLLYGNDYILIDVRSEKEFEETNIPTSVNFPILNNKERHFTGLVHKNYSELAAVRLAEEYAQMKTELLKEFLAKYSAKDKTIIVHCWRGGGRSKYLSKMIFDIGYQPYTITGGIKSYRNEVNIFFSRKEYPNTLLELSGLTGCGKTELINSLSSRIPVINLEKCARHFSSLFGFVPYKIRGFQPVKNQSAFENNVFGNHIFNVNYYEEGIPFLIESESKKVGDFYVPPIIHSAIHRARTIKIESKIEDRINRLKKDYFLNDSGFTEMIRIFTEKEKFFRRELSNVHYDFCYNSLKAGKAEDFILIMLKEYYDVKYRDKGKKPLAVISSNDFKTAEEEIINIYDSLN